ncbi:OmpA family protein [bacterium]|nr:OmpA family protein [bacterium]
MGRRFVKKAEEVEENVFWTTMSDMFLGLMMVFMTLFVFAMSGYSEVKVQAQQVQMEVAQELAQEMKQQQLDVDVDLMTGQVKISDLELFEVGSAELTPKGKAFLNKLFPVYISTIYSNPSFSNRILNILIQGHSDSQGFKDARSKEEQFIKNLDLSTRRAISVESYLLQTGYDKQYTDKLMKIMVAEGKSNSEPIIEDGKENYSKSRRVEFKLVLRDPQIQDLLIQDLKDKGDVATGKKPQTAEKQPQEVPNAEETTENMTKNPVENPETNSTAAQEEKGE